MSRNAALALLAVALLGCNSGALPPPSIVSVEPSQRAASASGPVTVTLDAVLPTVADYGAGTATVDDRMTLRIGARAFGPAHWTDGGVISDFLPSELADGRYDVTLELGDGRTASAPDAFIVTAGNWPASYSIDPIPTETSGVPFGVTIRANGPPGGGFGGTVSLSVAGATVSPTTSGPFQDGLRVEVITVTGKGPYQLMVSDLVSHFGTSNQFQVR